MYNDIVNTAVGNACNNNVCLIKLCDECWLVFLRLIDNVDVLCSTQVKVKGVC